MPKYFPKECKRCGVKKADGHYVSRRGFCEPCGLARFEASNTLAWAAGRGDMELVQRSMEVLASPAPVEGVGDTPRRPRKSGTASRKN